MKVLLYASDQKDQIALEMKEHSLAFGAPVLHQAICISSLIILFYGSMVDMCFIQFYDDQKEL